MITIGQWWIAVLKLQSSFCKMISLTCGQTNEKYTYAKKPPTQNILKWFIFVLFLSASTKFSLLDKDVWILVQTRGTIYLKSICYLVMVLRTLDREKLQPVSLLWSGEPISFNYWTCCMFNSFFKVAVFFQIIPKNSWSDFRLRDNV